MVLDRREARSAVVTADGATLTDAATEVGAAELTAYNLTVVGFHTYFDGVDHVLVHNCTPASTADDTPRGRPGTAVEPLCAQAPNHGFRGGCSRTETIRPGTVIDRYGSDAGRFFSPAGAPFQARALPAGSGPLQRYEVLKPLDVQAGVVAPAFGQPGTGIQYMSSQTVADLIEAGFPKAVG